MGTPNSPRWISRTRSITACRSLAAHDSIEMAISGRVWDDRLTESTNSMTKTKVLSALAKNVQAVRAFNRFWTAQIGVLRQSHLDTQYSLTEARVIFELAQRDVTELVELRARLRIDPGYLSRIIARFRESRLVVTMASPADGRRQLGKLTAKGRRVFELLDARSIEQVQETLGALGTVEQERLVAALQTARALFDTDARAPRAFVLRAPAPGDYGWIVERH